MPGDRTDERRRRPRRERHEGRPGGDDRARPRTRGRRRRTGRSISPASSFRGGATGVEFSPLPDLFDHSRLVHDAELAILLEPTDNTIQAGCLGNLNARITFHGVSGHSARPWTAENAIDKALDGLRAYAQIEPRPVEIGGLTFTGGREHHPDRRRDREQRHPRPRGGERQLPATPRSLVFERRRVPPQPAPGGRDVRARRRLSARPRRHRLAARAPAARGRRPGDSSRSRRGRTSPTSPPAGSTPSTSGLERRATRTGATSRSRSRRSSGRSSRSGPSSRVPSDRARLPHSRAADHVSVRAPERGCTARRGARESR